MKNIRISFLSAATCLILASCNHTNQDQKTEKLESNEAAPTKSVSKTSQARTFNTQCFEDFDYDYRQMLTKEDVLKHVSIPDPQAMDVQFKERSRKEYNQYTITWPSDRPEMTSEIKTGTVSITIPTIDNNIVAIEKFEFKRGDAEKALSAFNRAYGKLSEQEYRAMEERIDQQQADKSEEERQVMKSMIRARENMSFHPVADLGSGAYWEREEVKGVYFGTNLHVLAGTMQFRIKVKINNDDQENAKLAALLAKEILKKCP